MMASKLFLYNFSSTNIYQTCFYNVCVGKKNCFYFCPYFYEKFISGSILHQSIIYEQNNEVSCCCLNCQDKFCSETNFSDEFEGYFNQLKNFLIQYYYVFDNGPFMVNFSYKIL